MSYISHIRVVAQVSDCNVVFHDIARYCARRNNQFSAVFILQIRRAELLSR